MRFSSSSSCLTRVCIDNDVSAEVAQVHDLMLHIQRSLTEVPHPQRVYVGNALLNLAVDRLLREESNARAAAILHRLSDVIAT
jgi:hypothetical protein